MTLAERVDTLKKGTPVTIVIDGKCGYAFRAYVNDEFEFSGWNSENYKVKTFKDGSVEIQFNKSG